jgi:hypothetical protein
LCDNSTKHQKVKFKTLKKHILERFSVCFLVIRITKISVFSGIRFGIRFGIQ